jgi:uncharacterized protein YecE (DUF72 family)
LTEIRIGTSGWSYDEWVGVFYPDKKTPKLSYYSKIFNTVEVDSTFYTYPNRNIVFGWAKYTPNDFKFSLKIPKVITHEKNLSLKLGAEEDLRKFLDLLTPLHQRNKLGPLLIQLPPTFDLQKKTLLEEFLKSLPTENKFAVEFRNKSWLEEGDASLLEKYNVANTVVDEPLLPPTIRITADFAFIRWHGHGKRPWYNYRYKETELQPWVEKIKEIERKTKEIYGYFNNHFYGYAVENSIEFLEKLRKASEDQKRVLKRAKKVIEEGGKEALLEESEKEETQTTLTEFPIKPSTMPNLNPEKKPSRWEGGKK